ncbi:MAG: hypothetical protein ACPKOI_00795 [Pleomorphochaeta sp.]
MNKFKKVILSIIVSGLIIATPVFATVDSALLDTATQVARTSAFMPVSSHRMAMGGAGLGLGGFYDSYLYNPANLSKDGFKIVLPSLTLTVNNVYNLMIPEDGSDDIITILEEGGDNAPVKLGTLLLKSIPFGYGEIMSLNTNVGLKTRSLGLDLAVQQKLRSYNGGGDYTTASAISETNIAATVALGFNIPLIKDILSIDVGASGAFNYKAYSMALDANEAINIISLINSGSSAETAVMESIPFASGYAIPVTAGVNINLPLGLTISGVGRNFNGNYNMVGFTNLKSLINNDETLVALIGEDTLDTTNTTVPTADDEFVVEVPWTVDVGLAFAPSTPLDGLIKAQFAFDFIDCYGIIEDIINETRTPIQLQSDALASLNAGVQLRLLSLVDVRAGLSQGYKSVGVGLDLLVLHLDASYYWREYGDVLGQSPSDALSLKFSFLSK